MQPAENQLDLPDPAQQQIPEEVLAQLLASDLAVEIQAEFNGRMSVGFDVPAATGHVLGRFHTALASQQDGPVVLIALAAFQLREGHLQEVMRAAALDLIESGEALAAYRPADYSQRKSVAVMLQQFRGMLSAADIQED